MATINGKDLVFYVKDDGSINFYESETPKEADLKPYRAQEIQQDSESVYANEQLGLVTAVAYRDPATGYEEVSATISILLSLPLTDIFPGSCLLRPEG